MQRYVLIIVLYILVYSCSSEKNRSLTKINFERSSYDSLNLEVYDTFEYTFKFKNVGRADLIINKVVPSCNCQVIDWNSNSIKTSESNEIIIKYSSPYAKTFQENVLVYFNGSDSPKMLSISGNVVNRQ
jgi:hypothetical protein